MELASTKQKYMVLKKKKRRHVYLDEICDHRNKVLIETPFSITISSRDNRVERFKRGTSCILSSLWVDV